MWGIWESYFKHKHETEAVVRELRSKFVEADNFAHKLLSIFYHGFDGCSRDFLIDQEDEVGHRAVSLATDDFFYRELTGKDSDPNYLSALDALSLISNKITHADSYIGLNR